MSFGFDVPVFASAATVRETLGNGFVTQIDVIALDDSLHTVWTGVDPSQPGTPVDFLVSWPQTEFLVKGIKVHVNTDHGLGWEEIDAVQLRGITPRDFYRVTLNSSQPLEVETFTFAGGPGEFENPFDPKVRVYDAAGSLVASDDNVASDGRNARLKYNVPRGAGGTYFVEVGPSFATPEATVGEYLLRVKGGTVIDGNSVVFDVPVSLTEGNHTVKIAAGAVLGRLEQFTLLNAIYLEDFESEEHGFTVDNGPANPDEYLEGLWHLSTGRGAQPGHTGNSSFYYGQGESSEGGGTYSLGEFTPTTGSITSPPITLPADTTLVVDFSHVLQTRGFPPDVDFASLQINDGGGWTTLQRYDRVAETSAWTTTNPVNLSPYAGQEIQLRWSFDTRRGPVGRAPEGWYVDDVRVSEAALDDYYSFQLQAGESVTVALTGLTEGNLEMTLLNPDGSHLAQGSRDLATNVDLIISDITADTTGTYHVGVTGDADTEYSLVVTRSAAFDTEPNDSTVDAQELLRHQLAGREWVLGAVIAAVPVTEAEANDTIETAQNIDDASWNLEFNPNIGDSSSNVSTNLPHVTIQGTGDDTFDSYSFTVSNAGDVGIFDPISVTALIRFSPYLPATAPCWQKATTAVLQLGKAAVPASWTRSSNTHLTHQVCM